MVIRIYRLDDGRWWTDGLDAHYATFDTFDDLPDPVKRKLAVLLLADAGTVLPEIGRAVDNDVFWVYM